MATAKKKKSKSKKAATKKAVKKVAKKKPVKKKTAKKAAKKKATKKAVKKKTAKKAISKKAAKKKATKKAAPKKKATPKKKNATTKKAATPSKKKAIKKPNVVKAKAPKAKASKPVVVTVDVEGLFTPLDDRLIVQIEGSSDKTAGGIFIPNSANTERPNKGTVLAVGRGHQSQKGKIKPMDVQVGDAILFAAYTGNSIFMGETEVLVMREGDVLGIVES